MVVIPCSMRTLGSIAHGNGEHLVHLAADVVLKERRRLVLVARESPLSELHLDNMLKLARMGATIIPPMPAFYNHPKSISDIVDHIVARVLDQFGIPAPFAKRWDGQMKSSAKTASGVGDEIAQLNLFSDHFSILSNQKEAATHGFVCNQALRCNVAFDTPWPSS